MKNVFIVGARGYHANYGGWETFVSNLVDYYDDSKTRFYVGELSLNKDKSLDKINDNLFIMPTYVKASGSVRMFIYTIKSYLFSLRYIRKNKLENSYIYVLGLKLGPMLFFNKILRHR